MNVKLMMETLDRNPDVPIHIMLPDGSFVPSHFHITEVGRVEKNFIDCGGTNRQSAACVLQVWVADDVDHRIVSSKLHKILTIGKSLLSDDLKVEMEYEKDVISQFPLNGIEVTPAGLLFVTGKKHTDCLAPDKCGVSGCC